MKTVENTLSKKEFKKVAKGDCYHNACEYVLANKDWTLVHGHPVLQGNSKYRGMRFGHAWVEKDGVVYDTEADITIPADLYYAIGQIDKDEVKRYTTEEARRNILDRGIWGPWE